MPLLEILLGTGLVAGTVVATLVYLAGVRRGTPFSTRLQSALACGIGCSGSFLVPYAFSQELENLYFRVLKAQAIAVTPREWLAVNVTTGLLIAAVVTPLAFGASRFQRKHPIET